MPGLSSAGCKGRAIDLVHGRVETADAMRTALGNRIGTSFWQIIKCPVLGVCCLEILKASGLDLPFIIVSGTIGEEKAVA